MGLGSRIVVALSALVALLSLGYLGRMVLAYQGAELAGTVVGRRGFDAAQVEAELLSVEARGEVSELLAVIAEFVDGELRAAQGTLVRLSDEDSVALSALESRLRAIAWECSIQARMGTNDLEDRRGWFFAELPREVEGVIVRMERCAGLGVSSKEWVSVADDLRERAEWFAEREA